MTTDRFTDESWSGAFIRTAALGVHTIAERFTPIPSPWARLVQALRLKRLAQRAVCCRATDITLPGVHSIPYLAETSFMPTAPGMKETRRRPMPWIQPGTSRQRQC